MLLAWSFLVVVWCGRVDGFTGIDDRAVVCGHREGGHSSASTDDEVVGVALAGEVRPAGVHGFECVPGAVDGDVEHEGSPFGLWWLLGLVLPWQHESDDWFVGIAGAYYCDEGDWLGVGIWPVSADTYEVYSHAICWALVAVDAGAQHPEHIPESTGLVLVGAGVEFSGGFVPENAVGVCGGSHGDGKADTCLDGCRTQVDEYAIGEGLLPAVGVNGQGLIVCVRSCCHVLKVGRGSDIS